MGKIYAFLVFLSIFDNDVAKLGSRIRRGDFGGKISGMLIVSLRGKTLYRSKSNTVLHMSRT